MNPIQLPGSPCLPSRRSVSFIQLISNLHLLRDEAGHDLPIHLVSSGLWGCPALTDRVVRQSGAGSLGMQSPCMTTIDGELDPLGQVWPTLV